MTSELQPHERLDFSARADQPLIGIPVDVNGQEQVRYFASEQEADQALSDDGIQEALSLAGAWQGMDWDGVLEELDRIRHESRPTPPVDLEL